VAERIVLEEDIAVVVEILVELILKSNQNQM
jgi:hypothetical protein